MPPSPAEPRTEGWLASEPWAPRSPLLARALTCLIVLACLSAIGAMLILPDASKAVGLVYGGF